MNSQNSKVPNTQLLHSLLLEKPKTRVLLIKIPIEDYQAYKIFADQMFYESISTMV